MEQQRGRRRLGEAKWRELLSRFDAGSDTVEVFCRRHGVTKSSFQRWRSRTAGCVPGAAPTQGEVQRRQAGFVDLGLLSRLSGQSGSSGSAGRLELTLDLGGGVTLRVARG